MIPLAWVILVLLPAAQAAPYHPGGGRLSQGTSPLGRHGAHKRQLIPQVVFSATQFQIISETETETYTETITTTSQSTFVSSVPVSSDSATSIPPEVHFVGDIPGIDPNAQSILFLPLGDTTSTGTGTASIGLSSVTSAQLSATSPVSATVATTTTASSDPDGDTDNADSTDASSPSTVGPAMALNTPVVKGPLLSAYYPDWAASDLPPEKIDMTRFDWIDFAFATLDKNFNLVWDDPDSSPDILNRLVAAAHAKGTKVKLSIGGWDGSRYFSAACATSATRKTTVNNIVNVYNQFKLDGIDIDWEYPGQQGVGNNGVNPQDSANFLAMLKLLRTSLPKSARISAAVQDVPFADSNGDPLQDVSAFAAVLDWVNIMNYDVFSSSDKPGPNAPLSDGCKDSSQPGSNAEAAINAWSAAKFPRSRLMLGVPAYGYVNPSKATTLQHKRSLVRRQALSEDESDFDSDSQMTSSDQSSYPFDAGLNSETGTGTFNAMNPINQAISPLVASSIPGTVTLKSEDGSTSSGQIQFNSLVSQGALLPVRVGGGNAITFLGIGGFTRFWDSCSSTPFLTSPYANQVITYDDPQSLGEKASFAKTAKILGTAVWDLSGDTEQWDLINALRQGLGKPV